MWVKKSPKRLTCYFLGEETWPFRGLSGPLQIPIIMGEPCGYDGSSW